MRFDLELRVVSLLTKNGLDNLSEMLYGINGDITPMSWDDNSVTNKSELNRGSINLSTYRGLVSVDDQLFNSGVDLASDSLKFVENIKYGSNITPVFNGGTYYSNKSKNICSKNNIVKRFGFKENRYQCNLDASTNIDNSTVSTMTFVNPGYTKNKKVFIRVHWNYEYYSDLILTGSSPEEAKSMTLDYVFKKNKADYKFCLYEDVIYLSAEKIEYKNKVIGKFQDTTNKIFVIPEFPVENFTINGFVEGVDYTIRSGIIVFKSTADTQIDTNLVASWDVVPMISYLDEDRSKKGDYIYFNTNMHPRLVNYRSGALCLTNNFGDTGVPLKLELSANKINIFGSEPLKVTARLSGTGDIAIPNKNITLELLTDNATFLDSNSSTINKLTFADGRVTANIVAKTENIGYYIQPSWVSANKINIPFEIEGIDIDKTYLYIMTGDDPILGKSFSEINDTPLDTFCSDNTLKSLSMNGRKIAYVSLQDSNGTLTSRFIKPTESIIKSNQVVQYLNTFSGIDKAGEIKDSYLGSTLVNDVSSTSLGWPAGCLPSDRAKTYSYSFPEVTEITFEKNIPTATSGDIRGYWLITDGIIKVKASFNSEDIILESQTISVPLSYIKTENSFVLNKYNTSLGASQLGQFGYLSISEYIKNPYGLNAFSYYCTHSDCIYKRCSHPDPTIQKNFILDSGKVGCIHNSDWDANPNNSVCPAQDANLVNPFIMHLQGT